MSLAQGVVAGMRLRVDSDIATGDFCQPVTTKIDGAVVVEVAADRADGRRGARETRFFAVQSVNVPLPLLRQRMLPGAVRVVGKRKWLRRDWRAGNR